jgi:hypothetical protein
MEQRSDRRRKAKHKAADAAHQAVAERRATVAANKRALLSKQQASLPRPEGPPFWERFEAILAALSGRLGWFLYKSDAYSAQQRKERALRRNRPGA